jgi:hypothetical protein
VSGGNTSRDQDPDAASRRDACPARVRPDDDVEGSGCCAKIGAQPSAERQGIAVSAADIATAQRLGSLWWLFALGVLLSFGSAAATLGKLMQRLATPSEA